NETRPAYTTRGSSGCPPLRRARISRLACRGWKRSASTALGHNRTLAMPSERARSTICGLVQRLTCARLWTSRSRISSGLLNQPSDRLCTTLGSVWKLASSGTPRRKAKTAPQAPKNTGFTTWMTSGSKALSSAARRAEGIAKLNSGYQGKGNPGALTTLCPACSAGALGGASTSTSWPNGVRFSRVASRRVTTPSTFGRNVSVISAIFRRCSGRPASAVGSLSPLTSLAFAASGAVGDGGVNESGVAREQLLQRLLAGPEPLVG